MVNFLVVDLGSLMAYFMMAHPLESRTLIVTIASKLPIKTLVAKAATNKNIYTCHAHTQNVTQLAGTKLYVYIEACRLSLFLDVFTIQFPYS